MATSVENSVINKVKVWLFQPLLAVLGWFLVDSIVELKADVKKVLEILPVQQTEIIYMKKEIDDLRKKLTTIEYPPLKNPEKKDKEVAELVMILPSNGNETFKKRINHV
jgi:hypothetical protein